MEKNKLDKEIILGAIFGIIAIIAIICEMSLGGFSKEAIPDLEILREKLQNQLLQSCFLYTGII